MSGPLHKGIFYEYRLLLINYTDGADQHFTYTLTLSKGTVFVLCMPLLKSVMDNSSNCSIQYTKDSSFNNLSKPVIGPFNIPFAIPIKETTLSVYYLQAAVVVNSSLVITVRSSKVFTSTNGSGNRSSEDDSSTSFLTPATAPPGTVKVYQVALLCLFLGISLLALVISIGIIVFLVHKLSKYIAKHISFPTNSLCLNNSKFVFYMQ